METVIEFWYDGPVVSVPLDPGECGYEESRAAEIANLDAWKLVKQTASDLGIQQCHEYSWPDGSLSLRFTTDLPDKELMNLLNAKLPLEKVRAIKAWHYPRDPIKERNEKENSKGIT
jgi:hypothetical protein